MARLTAVTLALSLPATVGYTLVRSPSRTPVMPSVSTETVTRTVVRTVASAYWHRAYRAKNRELMSARRTTKKLRRTLRQQWRPTVTYALRLASAVSGVPYTQLAAVSWCESRWEPYATNGRYQGLFQLGWSPFGFSPFDPVANALSAALTVVHDGSWRQWECKP
jgi:hypothetical protein